MRVSSLLAGSFAFVALGVQAAPLLAVDETGLISYIKGHVQSALGSSSCPAYDTEDRTGVFSVQDHERLESLAGVEYWFRFEDQTIVNAGDNILPLARRGGAKDYDDQAYKWISSDASRVTRNAGGRWATLYVLPQGKRAEVNGRVRKFEDTSEREVAAEFVTKDNEPGDIGVNGIARFGGALPLDVFRNQVIRTVILRRLAGGKFAYTTITKGRRSDTAIQDDQKVLERFK